MEGRKLEGVEAVRGDHLGAALQEMLGFIGRDLRHSGEDMGCVNGRTLDAVPMIDLPVRSFLVSVELVHMVVKVDAGVGAEVPPQKSGVSGEDGGALDVPHPAQDESHPGEPFMEVGHHLLVPVRHRSILPEEPRGQVPEENRILGVLVSVRAPDFALLPQVVPPLPELRNDRIHFEEDHLGGSVDKPPPKVHPDPASAHCGD
mmetsp:Transcript_19306/g.50188  ORF Transcript_19306/g.50188 Transcript_19306/m.50188 type:complete len:203 (-) Transcript_19306:407-1015(-)